MKLLKIAIITAALVIPVHADELSELLKKESNNYNKSLPIAVDSDTTIFSTVAYNHVLAYYAELTNYSAGDLNGKRLRVDLLPLITNRVCSTDEAREFIDRGVTLRYVFFGNKGKKITEVSIDKSDCGPGI